MFNWWSWSVL